MPKEKKCPTEDDREFVVPFPLKAGAPWSIGQLREIATRGIDQPETLSPEQTRQLCNEYLARTDPNRGAERR